MPQSKHLREACEWARNAADKPMPLNGHLRKYDWSKWDDGTSCCLYAAACLLAGEILEEGAVAEDHYADLTPANRAVVRWLLHYGFKDVDRVLSAMDGKHGVHPDAKIGKGVMISQTATVEAGCDIGDYTRIFSYAKIESGAWIGRGAWIEPCVEIAPDAKVLA